MPTKASFFSTAVLALTLIATACGSLTQRVESDPRLWLVSYRRRLTPGPSALRSNRYHCG